MGKRVPLFVSVCICVGLCWSSPPAYSQPWSDITVRSLPDMSFALVEFDKDGKKLRHLPYRDKNGLIDMNQLIFCLGTLDEEAWVGPKSREMATRRLEEHYHRLKLKQRGEEIVRPIHVNTADLEELVRLPNIGPVLAVRIYRYIQTHGPLNRVEDVKKVEGVGTSTLAGIRHYIVVED